MIHPLPKCHLVPIPFSIRINPIFNTHKFHFPSQKILDVSIIGMMRYTIIKDIERKVRRSKDYNNWVIENKAPLCFVCNSTDNLECHHVVALYHIILGIWKLYGDAEKTYQHVISLHNDNRCESVTLCDKCHSKGHPGKQPQTSVSIRKEFWSVLPRQLPFTLCHTKSHRPHSLGLIGFQTLLGIGHYILNGHMKSHIIKFHKRRFAELIGKKPGSSFNKSFNKAIRQLDSLNIVIGSHQSKNDVELHLSRKYVESTRINPWFMPLTDIRTSKMCVLALKWFLGMQSNRQQYRIGLKKLTNHLSITDNNMFRASQAVQSACADIPWASVEIKKRTWMCSFRIKKRGGTPVFSLRNILEDSIQTGR